MCKVHACALHLAPVMSAGKGGCLERRRRFHMIFV